MKMKRIIITISALLAMLVPVMTSAPTSALFDNAKGQVCQGVTLGGAGCGDPSSLNTTIKNVINILSVIIGIAAVIMIMVGGFKYVASAGDSSKTGSARATIVSALVGLVIVAMAQFIVQFVLSRATSLPACPAGKTQLDNGGACKVT